MSGQEDSNQSREIKRGDSFISIHIVDLAVALFTLSYPFYDPKRPYMQQVVNNDRSVRFLFLKDSKIEGLPSLGKLIRQWDTAEEYSKPLSPLSICKRTIWFRRTMLRQAASVSFEVQGLAKENEVVVDSLKLACVAYALGFSQPENNLVHKGNGASFIVGTTVPEWLLPYCSSWDELVDAEKNAVDFIARDTHELHPVAIALAAFINIAAWVKHLSSEKPYRRFAAGANKTLLVQEGSPKWVELLANGYVPE